MKHYNAKLWLNIVAFKCTLTRQCSDTGTIVYDNCANIQRLAVARPSNYGDMFVQRQTQIEDDTQLIRSADD